MLTNCITILCLFSFLLSTIAAEDRHIIYWDSEMTPKLATGNFVWNVQIGQFMDILCPQTSLAGINNGPKQINSFDLYNVTENEFEKCETGERSNLIFSCDRPEMENKLTIKFQLISPSPLGFRFQYCQDYYVVAKPRGNANSGCHKEATKLHISVACKETHSRTSMKQTDDQHHFSASETKKYKGLLTRILSSNNKMPRGETESHNSHETILVPKLVHLTEKELDQGERMPQVLASSSEESQSSGRGSATSFIYSTNCFGLAALTFLTVFWTFIINC